MRLRTNRVSHHVRYLVQLTCVTLFVSVASPSFSKTEIEARSLSVETLTELVATLQPTHPSLFGPAAHFERLRQATQQTELGKIAFGKLIYDSESLLQTKPLQRVMEGRRLLDVSRGVLYRVTTLAMSYRLTNNSEYLARCEAELLCASSFSDWNPSHFLDVAEMTLALAVGYDWLYHELAPESRALIYQAILEKGLQTSITSVDWVEAPNNWGQVCHASMMAGALATLGQNRELSIKIIHRAIRNLPRPMSAYAPQGAYPEGPGYWSYGTDFNVYALDLLFSHLNTDFGLSTLPGFEATMDYTNIMTGPSGLTFNYSDGTPSRSTDPALWWFAKHYARPDILNYFEIDAFKRYCGALTPKGEKKRHFAIGLLWLQTPPEEQKIKTPLHWSSESKNVITVHRTSWDDQKALFVGFKGGSPSAPHGHMDAGSFVLDYAGIRWAWDLGPEDYNRLEQMGVNLWNMRQDSTRWNIFRLNSFSHNTLVIDGQLQKVEGVATLKSFKAEPAPETVLDLTSVYKGQASSVIRTGKLLPSGELQIIDTLSGLAPGATVRWAMAVKAKPTLSDTPVMTLTEKDETLTLTIRHDATARWQIIDIEKPGEPWEYPNTGFKLIAFETVAPESGKITLNVLITPSGSKSVGGTNRYVSATGSHDTAGGYAGWTGAAKNLQAAIDKCLTGGQPSGDQFTKYAVKQHSTLTSLRGSPRLNQRK